MGRFPAETVGHLMKHAGSRVVHNDVPALGQLGEPPVVLGVDTLQGKILQANQGPMIGVVDLRDPPEMLDDLAAEHE